MPTIKNIYVIFEEGLEPLAPRIKEAIEEMMDCFPKFKKDYPITMLGNWKSSNYKYTNEQGQTILKGHESIDWYIARAIERSKREGRFQRTGQISVEQLAEDTLSDPYAQKIPQWQIFVTKRDLYAAGLNYCLGYSQEDKFSIISTARFIDRNNMLNIEGFKTVLMHEFGHLIGLTNENRVNTEEKLGPHCTNDGCIMQQRMNGDFTDLTNARLRKKRFGRSPVCQDCINEGNKFFVRQRMVYNHTHGLNTFDGITR